MGFFDRFGKNSKTPVLLEPVEVDVQLVTDGSGLSSSIGDFGLRLAAVTSDKNTVLSAFSAYEVWLRVWAGARGECRDEISRSMGLKGNEVRARLAEIVEALERAQNDDCVIESANAIWKRATLELESDYREAWGASIRDLDFSDAKTAAASVNAWVSEQTRGMIPRIVSERDITPVTAMILANALYLDAKWAFPFSGTNTSEDEFTPLTGQPVRVSMMYHVDDYKCAATDDFELLTKPYVDSTLEFVVVLPREKRFSEVCAKLTWPSVLKVLDAARPVKTLLSLPRFRVESSPDIDDLLKSKGARLVYQQKEANLSAMSSQALNPGDELFVSLTRQICRIEVAEKGTKAAAVTAVIMQSGAVAGQPKDPPYPFCVNRPFLYFVVERTTGTPIFSGHVVELGADSILTE